MQAFSSKNKHRKMQDPLSFSFHWGGTFDTPPYKGLLVLSVNPCTPTKQKKRISRLP